MANQKAVLKGIGASGTPYDIRVTLVDSDGGAATFTDFGAAASYTAPEPITLVDIVGQGTTAPATATAFQLGRDGNDLSVFFIGAAIYDPTSTPQARLGSAFGRTLRAGSTYKITGRA